MSCWLKYSKKHKSNITVQNYKVVENQETQPLRDRKKKNMVKPMPHICSFFTLISATHVFTPYHLWTCCLTVQRHVLWRSLHPFHNGKLLHVNGFSLCSCWNINVWKKAFKNSLLLPVLCFFLVVDCFLNFPSRLTDRGSHLISLNMIEFILRVCW